MTVRMLSVCNGQVYPVSICCNEASMYRYTHPVMLWSSDTIMMQSSVSFHPTTELYHVQLNMLTSLHTKDVAQIDIHTRFCAHFLMRTSAEAYTAYCLFKNTRLCRVVRYRTLEEELTGASCKSDALRQALTAEDSVTNASLYILLRAVDQFYSKHHRYPGLYDQ